MKGGKREAMREIMIEAEMIATFGAERSKALLQEIYDRLDELAEDTDNSFQKDLESIFYPYLAATEVLKSHKQTSHISDERRANGAGTCLTGCCAPDFMTLWFLSSGADIDLRGR